MGKALEKELDEVGIELASNSFSISTSAKTLHKLLKDIVNGGRLRLTLNEIEALERDIEEADRELGGCSAQFSLLKQMATRVEGKQINEQV